MRFLLAAALVCATVGSTRADTVELVNGNKIYGKCMYIDVEMTTPERDVYIVDIFVKKDKPYLRVRFRNGGQQLIPLREVRDVTPDDKDQTKGDKIWRLPRTTY